MFQFVNKELLQFSPLLLSSPHRIFEKLTLLSQEAKSDSKSQHRITLANLSDDQRVFEFIEKKLFCEEPLARSLKLCYKRIDLPFRHFLRDVLCQGKSLIAVDKDEKLIGLCLSQRYCHWHSRNLEGLADATNDIRQRKLLKIWSMLSAESSRRLRKGASSNLLASSQEDVFDLGIVWSNNESALVDLMGKSVDLARDLNYATARIDCTNIYLRKIVESLDMERIFELAYENIHVDDGSCRRAITSPSPVDTHAASYFLDLNKSKTDDSSSEKRKSDIDIGDNKV